MPLSVLFFAQSLAVGFIMAAPVGPVGVLCIRRTLRFGWIAGFTTGLGVAVADSFYGAIASLGLTSVSSVFVSHEGILRLVGGVILLFIGVAIYRSPAPRMGEDVQAVRLARNLASGLVLAFTNPLTILSFAAIYIGLGLGSRTEGSVLYAALFVSGVFIGSCAWWVLLSVGTARIRERVSPGYFTRINHACGVIIGLFGLVTLGSYLIKR